MVIEVQKHFYILGIAVLVIVALMIIWKNYNKRKYGRLHRRRFKAPVSNEELSETFDLNPEMIERMQSERLVVLPKNIIPEGLGIGKEKEDNGKEQRK